MGDKDKDPTRSPALDTVEEIDGRDLLEIEETDNLTKTPIQQFIEEWAEVEGELNEVNNISEYTHTTHIPRLEKFIAEHENPAYASLKALLDNEIETEANITEDLDKSVANLNALTIPRLRISEETQAGYEEASKSVIRIKNKIATKRNLLNAIRQIITIVLKAEPRIKKGSTAKDEVNNKEIIMVSTPESAGDIIEKIKGLKDSSDVKEKAVMPVIRKLLEKYSNDLVLLKTIHAQERTIRDTIRNLREIYKNTEQVEEKAKIEEELKSLIQDRKGYLKLMETLYLQRDASLEGFEKMIESLE